MTSAPEICMIEAGPRIRPKPLPEFANPERRPEGEGPPLVLHFHSDVPRGIDVAMARAPQRNTSAFLKAIGTAGNRTIICNINCAGGEAGSALAIADALLRHPFAVHCKILGRCSSAAAFIALSADSRSIVKTGSVLLHTARRLCTEEQWKRLQNSSNVEKQAINDGLADIDDAGTALLQSRLGVSEQTARSWSAEDRKWSAAEAVQRGFAIAADDHAEKS